MRSKRNPVGRPRTTCGLPKPVPGEPFSLTATLSRTTKLLSVADAAEITGNSKKTIYAQIKAGKIPTPNRILSLDRTMRTFGTMVEASSLSACCRWRTQRVMTASVTCDAARTPLPEAQSANVSRALRYLSIVFFVNAT